MPLLLQVRRATTALLVGGIAIAINTLALKAADLVPLATARGGLLRLVHPWLEPILDRIGVAAWWDRLGGPSPGSAAFATGFHVVVGLLMAEFYIYALEPWLPGGPWRKGLLYAALVWLLNAVVVLPATGEGFAGSAHLSLAGIAWFAIAHTLFFVILALGVARLSVPR
jgi:hypothetical protein